MQFVRNTLSIYTLQAHVNMNYWVVWVLKYCKQRLVWRSPCCDTTRCGGYVSTFRMGELSVISSNSLFVSCEYDSLLWFFFTCASSLMTEAAGFSETSVPFLTWSYARRRWCSEFRRENLKCRTMECIPNNRRSWAICIVCRELALAWPSLA